MTANLSILDNFLQFFFFHFRDICDDIYYFYTLFFFSPLLEKSLGQGTRLNVGNAS